MKPAHYKRFTVILLCALYGWVAAVALVNIVVDPYDIFRTPFLKVQSQANDRYAKIEFLKKNKERFNAYLVGSSRMLHTPADLIEKYIPMGSCYNLATILATVNEHLLHIKYFVRNGYPVKTLYVGVDVDFFFMLKAHREHDALLRLHPEVTRTNLIAFYWSYLSILPKSDIRRKLKANFDQKRGPKPWVEKNGAFVLSQENQDIPVFFQDQRTPGNTLIRNRVGRENAEYLKEVVALCRKHDIRLILFITPHHESIMDLFAEKDYLSFLRDLSEITPFWNFSGFNTITMDRKHYLDHSHYKPSVSRLIAARIFDDQTVPMPEDFGAWVAKENIDSHLEEVQLKFEKRRKLKSQGLK